MTTTPVYAVLALSISLALSSQAQADDMQGRLKRIQESKTFVAGYRESGLPFSYLQAKNQPAGYAVDITLKVAEALKQKLNLPDLEVKWNPATAYTRFPLMTTQTLDIECGQTTNTQARQEQVAFSNTYYVSEEGIATRTGSSIANYADLAGKRVAVAANTTTEQSLRGKGGMTLVPMRSNALAMRALADGKVDAYVAAKPILVGMLANLEMPQDIRIVGSGGQLEAFGCMLPKGDAAFKQVVDETLAGLMKSGEMEQLYAKWFTSPIPPRGLNPNLPLNEQTRQAFASPNDRAIAP